MQSTIDFSFSDMPSISPLAQRNHIYGQVRRSCYQQRQTVGGKIKQVNYLLYQLYRFLVFPPFAETALYSLGIEVNGSLDELEPTILVGNLSGAVLLLSCIAFVLQHQRVNHNRNHCSEHTDLQRAARWLEVLEVIDPHGLEARQTGIELRRDIGIGIIVEFLF